MLHAVAPILLAEGATFKIPQRIADVVYLNSGDAGFEQLGKVLTVYPHDDDAARTLLRALDAAWPCSAGPEVCTDLHVRPGSAVSFRFGVYRPGPIVVDASGRYAYALTHPDGTLSAEERRRDGAQPSAFVPPLDGYPPSSCPVGIRDELEVGDLRFVLLSLLSETPQSLVYLAADAASLDTAIVKLVRPGVGGDLLGQDCGDLLKAELEALSVLAATGVAPRPLGWREEHWSVLAMQDMRGERVSELPRAERLAALPGLARAVARVHAAGFVHGDIKLENAIRLEDRIVLIDFELAARFGAPMRKGGTPGHLAPEVSDGCRAAPGRDVYALAGCVFQALMDVPPGLLAAEPARLAELLRNEGERAAASLVEQFAAADPDARPGATAAALALETIVSPGEPRVLDTSVAAPMSNAASMRIDDDEPSNAADRVWCRRASVDAARAARSFARLETEGACWRNAHFQRGFDCEALNIGAAGILLGLMSIDAAARTRGFDHEIASGARWLTGTESDGKAAGLFTGNAGVALVLAIAARRLKIEAFTDAARERLRAAVEDHREMDFFGGSAGVLFASCLLGETLGETWPLARASELAHRLLDEVRCRGRIPVWGAEAARDYLGCAHGSAGFALALAAYGRRASDPAATALAYETFAALYRAGRSRPDALRMALQSDRHHAVGNWCHGVAGYLWSILQGFGDDSSLRDEIDWAVECLKNAPSVGTPTYCHGLAGQLELWCLLANIPRYEALATARAGKVARALRILQRGTEVGRVWASDDPDVVTPDLWVGFLGPATALALHAAESRNALLSPGWLAICAQPVGYN